ncbi:MAG: SurA N-terminal domain-containing protein [Muribaculaceae bacterium]|nr:SurA N-terminal domain-containing protein [Muribaculaceae bacterium]
MSALEHIRKRPALVISVLGLALVLFIITAVSDNIFSFFSDRDSAVVVDGEKLKYDKWKSSASRIADNMRQQGQEDFDFAVADEQALQAIINENLLDKQIEKLGINATDEEMAAYLFGPTSIVTPEAQRYGFATAEDFYSYAYSNEPGSENARALWQDMENRVRRQVLTAKFQLQLGAITANKLDAKAYYDENKNVTLSIAKVDYATLANDEFEVTEAEINERYNQNKENYKLETETRMVDYIYVTPTPSVDDQNAASEEVLNAISELKKTEGTEAIAGNYAFATEVHTASAATLPASLRNAVERIQSDTVVMLSYAGSTYNLAKLLSTKVAAEKADVDFFFTNNAVVPMDSVFAAISAGEINESSDSVQKVSQKTLNLVDNALIAEYYDNFVNATKGEATIVTDKEFKTNILNSIFGGQIDPTQIDGIDVCYRVNSVEEPQTIYEIAAITREVVPSNATISGLRQELADYAAKNANAKAFKENADSTNFSIMQGRVTGERFAVVNNFGAPVPQTVSAVRWAMEDAKVGDVSDVFEVGESFIVLAVTDIYSDYIPVKDTTINEYITNELRAEKKGAKLVADYAGKADSISTYATAMNTQPLTVRVNYAQNNGGIMGADPKFLGAVGAANEGQLVGPIATGTAAVVLQVTAVDNAGAEFDYDVVAPMAQRMFQFNVNQALRANKEIEYKALRFESRE